MGLIDVDQSSVPGSSSGVLSSLEARAIALRLDVIAVVS